jgi:hypothetical protein
MSHPLISLPQQPGGRPRPTRREHTGKGTNLGHPMTVLPDSHLISCFLSTLICIDFLADAPATAGKEEKWKVPQHTAATHTSSSYLPFFSSRTSHLVSTCFLLLWKEKDLDIDKGRRSEKFRGPGKIFTQPPYLVPAIPATNQPLTLTPPKLQVR